MRMSGWLQARILWARGYMRLTRVKRAKVRKLSRGMRRQWAVVLSIFIAVLSLTVTGATAYITYNTLRLERQYKELAITPNVFARISIENWGVSIVNAGVGPAIFKEMYFYFDAKCYYRGTDTDEFIIQNYLLKLLHEPFKKLDINLPLHFEVSWPPDVMESNSRFLFSKFANSRV